MKYLLKYIFTTILLCISFSLSSHSHIFRGLSVTEGLSDLVVNEIYKDSLGFVWIGTGNALERFDGVHLKHYPITGADEKLKRVSAIAEMPGNRIWMGNGTGLWRVCKDKNALEQIAPGQIDAGVRSLLSDGKGTLYIGSETGLFIYKDGNIEQVLLDHNVLSASNIVTGLTIDDDGLLWMATGNGLHCLNPADNSITSYHPAPGEELTDSYNKIARIGSMLFLGTMGQGIIAFDRKEHRFQPFVDVGCNVISSLSGDGKNTLYVGTDGNGVHFISVDDQQIIRSFRHEAGKEGSIRSNSVYSLLVDRDGLIWIGFYQLGLDYTLYQSDLFAVYSYPPYFSSINMPVRTIVIGEDEKLIGSRDGLFYIDEENRRFKSFTAPLMRPGIIMSSCKHRGKYYIGTYGGGMYVLDPETLQLTDFEPGEPQPFATGQIFCIRTDHRDDLWIGTSMGLYCYRDGKQIHHFTAANSKLPEGNIYEIYFDSTHKGWVCTENGLCIWDPSSNSLKTAIFPEGFIHREKIRTVFEDSEHMLYFLPDKGNLFTSDLSMSRFKRFRPNTPLEGKDCVFMLEDDYGWLWIGTNNGLYCYDKKETFIPYNFMDGMPGPIFTSCPPVKDDKGVIWLGNTKGLIYAGSDLNRKEKRYNYPVAITDIYANGKRIDRPVRRKDEQTYEVDLEASQNNLIICFSGFTYTDPAYASFEYMLEGEEKEWMVLTGKSDVAYYDLSPGTYRFRVRHTGSPTSEVRLSVRIAYPAVVWGLVPAGIVLLLAVFVYYRRKNRSLPPVETLHEPAAAAAEEKYKTNKVSVEECKRLKEKLDNVMDTEKPYTSPELKIADLARATGTSAHALSYLFNQYLNRNYYDYINDYRIAEFKRLVDKSEYAKYTLSALAELCGFSSRASFFRYFKKATGITPSEYIRSLGKTIE